MKWFEFCSFELVEMSCYFFDIMEIQEKKLQLLLLVRNDKFIFHSSRNTHYYYCFCHINTKTADLHFTTPSTTSRNSIK